MTTGLFPQQFIIQLKDEVSFAKLKTVTTNVRKISFERCKETAPTTFEKFYEVELASPQGGRIQQETHPVDFPSPIPPCASFQFHQQLCASVRHPNTTPCSSSNVSQAAH